MEKDSRVFKPSDRVAHRNIGGDAVLVDINQNVMFRLNETGSQIWFLLGERSVDQIAASLCKEFDVAEDTAVEDTLSFLSLLSGKGLVVESSEND